MGLGGVQVKVEFRGFLEPQVVMKSDGEFMYINLCLCVHFQSYNAICNCFGFARSPSLTEAAMQQNEDRVSKREQLKYRVAERSEGYLGCV
eukprot:scaffold10995_cov115-Skeletonema_marinoi.AAC.6